MLALRNDEDNSVNVFYGNTIFNTATIESDDDCFDISPAFCQVVKMSAIKNNPS